MEAIKQKRRAWGPRTRTCSPLQSSCRWTSWPRALMPQLAWRQTLGWGPRASSCWRSPQSHVSAGSRALRARQAACLQNHERASALVCVFPRWRAARAGEGPGPPNLLAQLLGEVLLALPRLADAEDEEQVEGIARLAQVLQESTAGQRQQAAASAGGDWFREAGAADGSGAANPLDAALATLRTSLDILQWFLAEAQVRALLAAWGCSRAPRIVHHVPPRPSPAADADSRRAPGGPAPACEHRAGGGVTRHCAHAALVPGRRPSGACRRRLSARWRILDQQQCQQQQPDGSGAHRRVKQQHEQRCAGHTRGAQPAGQCCRPSARARHGDVTGTRDGNHAATSQPCVPAWQLAGVAQRRGAWQAAARQQQQCHRRQLEWARAAVAAAIHGRPSSRCQAAAAVTRGPLFILLASLCQ